MEISLRTEDTSSTSAPATDPSAFMDPAFINDLLRSVDVDQNDPQILAALAQMGMAAPAAPTKETDSPDSKKRKGEEDDADKK